MIKETTDYEIFKKHPNNREISEGNVKKIVSSLQFKNLLKFRPIEVNAHMQIIDGQHRLEAAKRLGLPIFYEVKTELQKIDILVLNDSQKAWGIEDYINYHVSEGNENYIRLRRFMKKHSLNFGNALISLGCSHYDKSDKRDSMKSGDFIFPSLERELEAEDLLTKIIRFKEYAQRKLPPKSGYINGPRFLRAAYLFFSLKSVDFDMFMNKLTYRLDLIRPCARMLDFVDILKQIYNWRNKTPIEITELE